ncbi:MAG: Ig-like domain-containing protein [Bacteroidales bacterium]|nr:Ig-like domain-containing protein [Bacteroidales bacterium]
MNMKYKSLILALSAVLMTGCHSLETSNQITDEVPFTASSESFQSQTRTSMNPEKQVVWSSGDHLAIFQGSTLANEYRVSESSAGKTNGTFTRVIGSGDDFYAGTELPCNVAFYPYVADLTLSGAAVEDQGVAYSIAGYTLPASQNYTEKSFANGAFPMVAVTETVGDHNLLFKNILGAIKLQLKGDQTVTSIKITGKNNEKLSGAATITAYSNNLTPAITMTGADAAAKSVTLDCGAGVTLDESTATEFIIALPPVVFNQGFTVTVTDSESETYEINANTPNAILRSSILSMPSVTLGETPGDDDDVTYVEYLCLDRTSLTIYTATSIVLAAEPVPVDVTYLTLTWSSSDNTVAEVDQNGKVTAKSDGTATINVMAVGGVSATCQVKVKSATAVANKRYYINREADYGYGIVIGDVVWAPVNCGYEPADGEFSKGYLYGKLYQWGRKYGQGYDSNDASYPSGDRLVQGPVAPSWGSSVDHHAFEFFYGSYDWCNQQIDDLWADSNGKTANDPCPEGWRVPTADELESLSTNYSAWTKDALGHNGYYFTGEYTYMEGIPQVFLPTAGYRSYYTGNVNDRGEYGDYWSSTSHDSNALYLFFRQGRVDMSNYYRGNGHSVRCVQE